MGWGCQGCMSREAAPQGGKPPPYLPVNVEGESQHRKPLWGAWDISHAGNLGERRTWREEWGGPSLLQLENPLLRVCRVCVRGSGVRSLGMQVPDLGSSTQLQPGTVGLLEGGLDGDCGRQVGTAGSEKDGRRNSRGGCSP